MPNNKSEDENTSENKFGIKIYAWNFRGFRNLEVPLDSTTFVVGDNSSGKSTILHLVSLVLQSDLELHPHLNEELNVGRYDFFSPYFNNADVIIGYEGIHEGKRIGKLVTLRRGSNANVRVTRCSYFSNGNIATIKSYGEGLMGRLTEIDPSSPFLTIYETHKLDLKFSKIKKKHVRGLPPNSPIALFNSFDEDELETKGFLSTYQFKLPGARHIAPVRGHPERFYDLKRTLTSSGKHFAVLWRDLKSHEAKTAFTEVDRFGAESNLFDSIEVKPLSKIIDDAPLIVRINKNSHSFFLNQVGVGVSQVVPVLVESIFAATENQDHLILFQQPELHLHPIAQSALGTFFFNTLHQKGNLIIETHSNYLIDRFRAELKEQSKDGCAANILFCENTPTGNTCTTIKIASNGKLMNAPESYFSFFISEFSKTMI